MLPLDDPRWQTYEGGYHCAYDASGPLRRLMSGDAAAVGWGDLWDELHHQGYVGQASYASVPWLVERVRISPRLEEDPLGLVALIELRRTEQCNPPVALELSAAYFQAIRDLPSVLASHPQKDWSEGVTRWAVACIALARGQRWLAHAYFELDHTTAARWFSSEFGWDFGSL